LSKGKGEGNVIGEVKERRSRRWEVMEKKRKLKGRREKITKVLSWKERRTRWKLEEIARSEELKGERVWIKGGRIRIERKWWR